MFVIFFVNIKKIKRSLGCIFYELLTLKLAFNGKSLLEIMNNIMNCNYEEINDSNENYDFYTEIVKK
mgnify:CR=1 FL=1